MFNKIKETIILNSIWEIIVTIVAASLPVVVNAVSGKVLYSVISIVIIVSLIILFKIKDYNKNYRYKIISRTAVFEYISEKHYRTSHILKIKSLIKELDAYHGVFSSSDENTNIEFGKFGKGKIILPKRDIVNEFRIYFSRTYNEGEEFDFEYSLDVKEDVKCPCYGIDVIKPTDKLTITVMLPKDRINGNSIRLCKTTNKGDTATEEATLEEKDGKYIYTWSPQSPKLKYNYRIEWDAIKST